MLHYHIHKSGIAARSAFTFHTPHCSINMSNATPRMPPIDAHAVNNFETGSIDNVSDITVRRFPIRLDAARSPDPPGQNREQWISKELDKVLAWDTPQRRKYLGRLSVIRNRDRSKRFHGIRNVLLRVCVRESSQYPVKF